jgi:phosphoribosyl-AMP cyclohydrolase
MKIDFEKGKGLVPVIVQDDATGDVLMLAYMNREAYQKTLETKKATYWSRSRQKLWLKGETSGNIQEVKKIYVDCDEDTLLLKVHQVGGAACHTGHRSCFYRKMNVKGAFEEIEPPIFNPDEVYK